jgi:hypothetical protein
MTLRDILVRAGDATFAHFDILRERYLYFFHLFFRLYTLALLALEVAHIFREKKNVHVRCASQTCHAKVARLSNVLHWKTDAAVGTPRTPHAWQRGPRGFLIFCLAVIA